MLKKSLIILVVFLVLGLATFGAGALAVPDSVALPEVITATTPCPVAGCTQPDGACHAADAVPVPDDNFEMVCPKVKGCADTTCHAWDRLTTHYNRPSDSSLNLWILAPVVFTVALVFIVRKMR
jgi:hypothetical protein